VEKNAQEITSVSPESVVKERLDFVIRHIFQYSFPKVASDSILWRDQEGLQIQSLSICHTLGRDETSDIVLNDHFVSRQHCMIEKEGNTWTLKDLGSRNGTFLNNDKSLTHNSLHSGDLIRIGNTTLVFMEPAENSSMDT